MELRINEACKHPANFMYVWASDEFLKKIDSKYRSIIRLKRMNQTKVLRLSAEKYGKTLNDYTEAIRAAFIDAYGMTPAKALYVLADGGTVAGKNWDEGVYGIGAVLTFAGAPTVNGSEVTVDSETGHIFAGGVDITDMQDGLVYAQKGGKTVLYQLWSKPQEDNVVFMSQYSLGKYRAQQWTKGDAKFSAKTGKEQTAADSADLWGSIISSIQVFIEWIISLFAGTNTREQLTPANTLPSQYGDGFVQEAGFGTAGMIALACVAGGWLIFGNKKKKKSAQA